MKITRRQLIFGAVGAGALLPLSYAVRVSLGGYSFPQPMKFMTPKEARIAHAMIEAVIPSENPFGISPESVNSVHGIDEFLRVSSPTERGEVRILFWLIEHVFPAVCGYWTKFTKLSPEQRVRLLERLERSRLGAARLLLRAIKTLVCFSYFSTTELQEFYGIKGWCGP